MDTSTRWYREAVLRATYVTVSARYGLMTNEPGRYWTDFLADQRFASLLHFMVVVAGRELDAPAHELGWRLVEGTRPGRYMIVTASDEPVAEDLREAQAKRLLDEAEEHFRELQGLTAPSGV